MAVMCIGVDVEGREGRFYGGGGRARGAIFMF